jgi:DNA-binding PadR family transcriptional regulator
VLSILAEQPMHAYRIQQVIHERGKDRVVNVRQRASVYQTIERLLRLGLVEVHGTGKHENRPERTVYALTTEGSATARAWVSEMVAEVGGEFPQFPVGLSYLTVLAPRQAQAALEQRADALGAVIADITKTLDDHRALPRLFLLEEEYRRIVSEAELAWTQALINDLRDGSIAWDDAWLAATAAAFASDIDIDTPASSNRPSTKDDP